MWYMYVASFHSSACTPPSLLVIPTSSIPLHPSTSMLPPIVTPPSPFLYLGD
ncbi:hypothetical protein C8R44DRAFT_820457 [Mycena epipterygia]|nr:hypothetical protein C8R44DRAFT_820457 [Mycena epipterygia]